MAWSEIVQRYRAVQFLVAATVGGKGRYTVSDLRRSADIKLTGQFIFYLPRKTGMSIFKLTSQFYFRESKDG